MVNHGNYPIILDEHNYVDWSVWVKSDLVTQDLWIIVESTTKPPNQEDDEVAFTNWSKRNFKALQLIWNSCGSKAFSKICLTDSAHIAWNTLLKAYGTTNNNSGVDQGEDDIIDLAEDNYVDWSKRVKSDLEAQNLWSIIESTYDPPRQEDDEVLFTNWEDKNFKALRVIRNSCGLKAFSKIKGIHSAKIAWDTLLEKYGKPKDNSTDDIADLCEDNYMNWSAQVKSTLVGQNLWSIIELTSDPPKQEDDEAVFTNWRDKNSKALCVIKKFCGSKASYWIKDIDSAKTAWITLARMYDLLQNLRTGKDLLEAVQCGDWGATEESLKHHPDLVNARITIYGETALHFAVHRGHVHIAEKLMELMPKENLEIPTIHGRTALDEASRYGNYQMVECILRKNQNLTSIETSGAIPLTWALKCGYQELGRYLYLATPKEILVSGKAGHGAAACKSAIYSGMWDITLDLIRDHPTLAFSLDYDKGTPVYGLASRTPEFLSGNGLSFWKRWIYSCMHVKLADATNEIHVKIPSGEVQANPLGLKHLYEIKLAHLRYHQILHHICEEIPNLNFEQRAEAGVYSAIFRAIKDGNFEFLYEIVRRNPDLLWWTSEDNESIFMVAVRYRQAKIFSLIYQLGAKNSMLSVFTNNENYILHVAGILAPSSQLNLLPGAALQMQRELQWFKEVESISLPLHRQFVNKDFKTADEVFTMSHENLRKEGEKWMKDTATSCTVVGALITTIMFAAAFTVPGGNNQDTGLPIFLREKLFTLFIISDSLSLFSSSTSLLMFMGILTSRYAEQDFLKSLPKKMIIGLFTLFFSIATMMIAFCATILLMLRGQSSTVIPLICLASIPVSLFGLNQFSLLIDMFNSTYGPSIFNRKMERWV